MQKHNYSCGVAKDITGEPLLHVLVEEHHVSSSVSVFVTHSAGRGKGGGTEVPSGLVKNSTLTKKRPGLHLDF